MATLIPLAGLEGNDGTDPLGSLITDVNGDLFGTAGAGGAKNDGTVFELVKTAAGYTSFNILLTFSTATGASPAGSLIADAAGDLFGTTSEGGANNDGTVFEIAKTATGYASTPTIISFTGGATGGVAPEGSLIFDANGDLFGATGDGGPDDFGTVFEIAKTTGGYASTPTTLASFNGTDGSAPFGGLIADAAGDLFGTTFAGGMAGDGPFRYGEVFEIAKTATGYSSTPTVLVQILEAELQQLKLNHKSS